MNEKPKKQQKEDLPIERKLLEENGVFSADQLTELTQVFQFFMNPKSKLLNLKDLIISLKSLGYFESHPHLSSVIGKIDRKFPNSDIDLPTFLNEICEILVFFFFLENFFFFFFEFFFFV